MIIKKEVNKGELAYKVFKKKTKLFFANIDKLRDEKILEVKKFKNANIRVLDFICDFIYSSFSQGEIEFNKEDFSNENALTHKVIYEALNSQLALILRTANSIRDDEESIKKVLESIERANKEVARRKAEKDEIDKQLEMYRIH